MTAPARFPDDNDRPWTAFRYVAGELTPDEAAAFEALLDHDQNAREAVADAVELAGAIALIGDPVVSISTRSRHRAARAVAWVAAGIAAGLLLGFGFDRLVLHPPTGPRPRIAAEVVSTWSDLRHHADDPDALRMQLALNDDSADLAATLALEPNGEGEVPSWMTELASLPTPDAAPRGEN